MKPLKQILTLTLMLMIGGIASAQPGDEQMHERLRSHKIAFLTRQLDLTPDEAQQFWPVYNEYDKKMHELRENAREQFKPDGPPKDLSEAEAAQKADDFIAFRQQEAALMAEYHDKFKAVLPATKVVKLYHAEEAFKRRLMEQLKERKGGRMGPPDQGQGGGRPPGPR